MNADVLQKLSSGQKACLRLVAEGFEAKEIARALGVSHHAVNERLRIARRQLGVSTSRQAARLLANAEPGAAYNRSVDKPLGVAGGERQPDTMPLSTDYGQEIEGGSDDARPHDGSRVIRRNASPFDVLTLRFWLVMGRRRNGLRPGQTLLLILVLTIGLGAAALVAVTLVDQMSRLANA